MKPSEAIANIEYARKWLGTEFDFSDEALDMAIAALKKLEKDSDKSCETCKHENEYGAKSPCRGCYMGTNYEDRYEPYTEEES